MNEETGFRSIEEAGRWFLDSWIFLDYGLKWGVLATILIIVGLLLLGKGDKR